MNLDEVLALFPDNTSGQISAADLREAVTSLAAAIQSNGARVTALEQSVPSVGTSVSGLWQLFPEAGGIPGQEQVTCDTGQFATASVLNFHDVAQGGTNWRNNLLGAASIYAQQQANPDNWIRYAVAGAPTDHGTWVSVPVTIADAAGVAGSGLWTYAVFVITGSPA